MNIRDHLIKNGVKNLRTFGYRDVNKDNILTDYLFSRFFLSMLKDNKGKGYESVDRIIDELIAEIHQRFLDEASNNGA